MQEVVTAFERRAAELAGIAMWTLDLQTREVTSSSVVRQHLELAPDDPAPTLEDWFAVVHPEDRDRLARAWRALLKEGREYVVEHRVLLPSGRLKHMRAVACTGQTADGRQVAHGLTQDVTDHRLASLRTAAERDRSRAVIARLREGYLLSADGVVLEVNDALCEMTGYPAEELVGTAAPYPFVLAEDADRLADLERAAVRDGGAQAAAELCRRDGARLSAEVTMTPLPAVEAGPLLMVTLRDTTSEREHERLLLARAETDPLTGVLNSRAFRDGLALATRASHADGEPVSLALVDVDHFKSVNDRFGHAVGDVVLQEVVQRLVAATGAAGSFARVGGEEFAVLLPGFTAEQAHVLMREALSALCSEDVDGVGRITASCGVAELLETMDDDALFRVADVLLYEAKARGRNQVR